MPISGVVIRLRDPAQAEQLCAEVAELGTFELGECFGANVAGVIDARDYPAHDATLDRLGRAHGVCAIDVVFHEFSDVSEFPALPKRARVEARAGARERNDVEARAGARERNDIDR